MQKECRRDSYHKNKEFLKFSRYYEADLSAAQKKEMFTGNFLPFISSAALISEQVIIIL
jgi:uncharacterized protein YeaO (DUF488 family)